MAQFRKDTNQFLSQEKTIFEAVMLADQYGNLVGAANPSGMAVDAFGRARTSSPLTLFDSFHRYQDTGRISTANSATDSYFVHNANSSSIICHVGTANGSYVYRESNRVFSYQPGKSLQILQTYVMAPAQTGLRQRYGYFGKDNGIFIEQDGHNLYFVIRNRTNGSVSENKVLQSDWNIDTMDGTNIGLWTEGQPIQNRNPSGLTLDMTKAQIMFLDIEWLGLGTVRCGFVINGQFIHCHSFHHSNILTIPYMGTACLPVRAEIENTANTGNSSNLRIVCTSVISEGGYELRGRQRTAGILPNNSYTMATAGVFYPVVSIRLKSERLDGIVIPKNIHVLGKGGNGSTQAYKLVSGATVTGGTWVDAGPDSSVQYNITGTAMSDGTDLKTGYLYVAQQGGAAATLDGADLFRYQLERNSFTGANVTLTLAVAGSTASDTCVGSIDWEEPT